MRVDATLVCINKEGDIVIVELKRDLSPRDVTAQVLDYGSWIINQSNKDISEKAEVYLQEKYGISLEGRFEEKFGESLPEVINENHSMIIVAPELDPQTERIIRYLSEYYGVNINSATFQYYQDDSGNEFISRSFLIDPVEVEESMARRSTGKRRIWTEEEVLEMVSDHAHSLYEKFDEQLNNIDDELLKKPRQGGFSYFVDGRQFAALDFQKTGLKLVVFTYGEYIEGVSRDWQKGGELWGDIRIASPEHIEQALKACIKSIELIKKALSDGCPTSWGVTLEEKEQVQAGP